MSETQITTWLCEKCGEVRGSHHEGNMCAKVAELKDQAAQLRGALQRCASYVGGSVDATASHLFHVLVADEVSSVVERLKKRQLPDGWHVGRMRGGELVPLIDSGHLYLACVGMWSVNSGGFTEEENGFGNDIIEIDGVPTKAGEK